MAYGLLQGLGQGMAQAGDFMMKTKADELKTERLRKYQMEAEQRQNLRQDQIRAEDRSFQIADTADTRQHQEGLLQKTWEREDSRENRMLAQEAAQLETQAAFAETSTKEGKEYKQFFNKSGKLIGEVEVGDAKQSTQRSYLDPMTAARLKSLDSEISAMTRDGIGQSQEDKDRLAALRRERDELQGAGSVRPVQPPPVPGARQAADGNWYVEQNGKFYRVD